MAASSSPPPPAAEGGAGSRVKARCRHFGSCGGCSLQDRPYEEQVRLKAGKVLAALSEVQGLPAPELRPSPEPWFYRNKMEFSFGDVYPPQPGGPTVKLGMKPKGRWYEILDLQECFLLSPETAGLLARVRAWAEENKVAPYNGHRKQGFLRHLVLREAKNSGERMVNLVTAPGELPESSFLEAVRQAYPATTVLWGINDKLADVAVSESSRVLYGPGHITEELRFAGRSLRFRISPLSFFQTNTAAAAGLYGLLRDWTSAEKPDTVLDLYCGGGGITLSIADCCRKAVGVESHPAAVADAQANAALNGLGHAEFYSGSVDFLLPALLALGPQVVICDPPRAGMNARVCEILRASGPGTLICVSCNPESLARDLEVLGASYRVERLAVCDLFPHTDHVETAALLKRR